MAKYLTKEEN
jgi:serine/threonine-protein phosphatase 2A regulatory subunit A